MLALCMVLCLVPTSVFAEEVGAEGLLRYSLVQMQ